MIDSHVQDYKKHIWRNLGDIRPLVNMSIDQTKEGKFKQALFLWRIKTEMGATYDRQ